MAWAEEYEKLVIRMNTPRVVIDNAACSTATLVKVDSARKHGVLLEAVQILTDLDLSIRKAYISSDGRWFMDVFYVTDLHGHKLTDSSLLSYIEQALGEGSEESSLDDCVEEEQQQELALELTGSCRPGLLSEVFAVLAELECCVAEAKVWTHKGRIASVISLNDDNTGSVIQDPFKIQLLESRLSNILKGDDSDIAGTRAAVRSTGVHPDRRLHQLMFADRDYERADTAVSATTPPPTVTVQNWAERGYSVLAVHCQDRPKLLFDVVCTLTDMEYVVFHGTIDTDGERAYQEFYIRRSDGTPISSEAERERMVECLQAAVARRASEGLKVELCTVDRRGLLSEVTRTFRENGLLVGQAEVSTKGEITSNVFFVTDALGAPADRKLIESVQQRLGMKGLTVCEESTARFPKKPLASGGRGVDGGAGLFYLGSFVKRNLYSLGLIRS